MATPSHPTTPPPKPPPPPPPKEKEAAKLTEHRHEKDDQPDDPDHVHPVGEIQLKQSEAMLEVGVDQWIADHDERQFVEPSQQPKHGQAVPGVSPTQKDDPGGRR